MRFSTVYYTKKTENGVKWRDCVASLYCFSLPMPFFQAGQHGYLAMLLEVYDSMYIYI